MNNWADKINTVICGDCLEVMKDIPDNSVDLIVTDPEWQKNKFNFLDELYRILKIGRYIFLMWHVFTVFRIQPIFEKLFNLRNIMVLKRRNFICNPLDKNRLQMMWIPVLFGSKGYPEFSIEKRKFDLKLSSDIWEFVQPQSNFLKEPKEHIWQKDILTSTKMIRLCSDKNEIILDPFLGSGTTAVACIETGRRFIGIEINPEYCKIAEKRIKQAYDKKRQMEIKL